MDQDSLQQRAIATLRKLNPTKVNEIIEDLTDEQLLNLVSRPKYVSNDRVNILPVNIGPTLRKAVASIRLLDIPPNERHAIFIAYCRNMKYRANTVKRYIQVLEKNRILFSEYKREPIHGYFTPERKSIIDQDEFRSIIDYCFNNISKTTAPIIVAFTTGLRTMEILQMTNATLDELKNEHDQVKIFRKQTVKKLTPTWWVPVYSKLFLKVIDILLVLYDSEYQAYITNNMVIRLFPFTPNTLVNRVRAIFSLVTSKPPPDGFGIHTFRYLVATALSNHTKNISAIQTFLQHKDVVTTSRYIHQESKRIARDVNKILNPKFQPFIDMLNKHTLSIKATQ